jgi:ADP-heptose:LPS heptosyltransferase
VQEDTRPLSEGHERDGPEHGTELSGPVPVPVPVPSEAPASHDPESHARILVIRLGALGDFVLSLGPLAAIRHAHPGAHITLLTTAPFARLARACPYCDEVWIDDRPPWWQPWRAAGLKRRLRRARFQRVYDLQTSRRTARYWRALGRPEWSGHVAGASHPHVDPRRNHMHTADRQREQLALAGIHEVPPADLSWVEADIRRFGVDEPYALLVPGGSAHRPKKRWPAEKYAALARLFMRLGITPVLLGGPAEAEVLAEIARHVPEGINLCGKTGFEEIAVLARGALGAVGNDTGPMHLAAAAGCPCLVLFSSESNPDLCAPRPGARGGKVAVLKRPDLNALSVSEVQTALPFTLPVKR